jgi:predicted  nucleic acid-binding Zn-ribbon protein
MRYIFEKIENELSEEKPDLDFIRKNLDRIKDEYNDIEWEKEELDDKVTELENDIHDLETKLEEFKNLPENEHTLDDYFLDKLISEVREKWRFSSTKLEQKLKESDII